MDTIRNAEVQVAKALGWHVEKVSKGEYLALCSPNGVRSVGVVYLHDGEVKCWELLTPHFSTNEEDCWAAVHALLPRLEDFTLDYQLGRIARWEVVVNRCCMAYSSARITALFSAICAVLEIE